MWKIVARMALALGIIIVCTTVAYSLLALLATHYIEPVRVAFSLDPNFRHHGQPVVDIFGSAVWLITLLLYSITVVFAVGECLTLENKMRVGVAAIIFIGSSIYVAIIHPTFLLAVLGLDAWRVYVGSVARHIPFLDEVYGRWALPRLRYQVLAGQMFLTTFLFLCGLIFGKSWRRDG